MWSMFYFSILDILRYHRDLCFFMRGGFPVFDTTNTVCDSAEVFPGA